MNELLYTIDKAYSFTYIIKKSKFICNLYKINDNVTAEDKIKEIKVLYKDARHNCYAYITKENNYITKKCSDDGEPSQTAGIVILKVLEQNNLCNVLAVCTRYFGGIKLGRGGLVRAYSNTTTEAVNLIEDKILIRTMTDFHIAVSYAQIDEILTFMSDFELVEKSFSNIGTFLYTVPLSEVDELQKKLINITKGKITF